jgi:hypothetical protein
METPAPTPRALAPGTVPLPIGEVLRIAHEYELGGRLDDSGRLLNHILGAAPNQGDALHLAGIVAFRQGDIAKALDLMERSLRHGIDTPLYLRNICEVYRAMGRLDEALDAARRAAPRPWRRPIRSVCTTRRSSTITGLNSTRRSTAPDVLCASIQACPARISFGPRRCCSAAIGRRVGRNTSGAFASPVPHR